ncbi:serine hydrolase [Patescibacteria group bacterium]|nr:serine hydrolase [Patescibacteria group bacterium]
MLSIIFNILALAMSVFLPATPAVYASGDWRGAEACVSDRHLPENADKKLVTTPAPVVEARSAAVLTDDGNIWLASQEASRRQPIASITKLMTALVFLEHNPGWDNIYTVKKDDVIAGGRINLFWGEEVKIRDLFNSSLIGSDNGATLSLARSTGLSDEEFVQAMNKKALSLGLLQTEFADAIGLDNNNLSNAKDVARLAQAALNQKDIAATTGKSSYSFKTLQGKNKMIESTDWLLDGDSADAIEAVGGKTGYTEEAGYCFVGRFRDVDGRSLITVVLDSGGINERFTQARILAKWAFTYCQW